MTILSPTQPKASIARDERRYVNELLEAKPDLSRTSALSLLSFTFHSWLFGVETFTFTRTEWKVDHQSPERHHTSNIS